MNGGRPMTLREIMLAEEPSLPTCPKCGAEDSMEHVKEEAEHMRPETHYDYCVVCGYETAPE